LFNAAMTTEAAIVDSMSRDGSGRQTVSTSLHPMIRAPKADD
jgi:hypothetical protein